MADTAQSSIRPDWISKTLAGAIAGLFLAFALMGLFAWFGPGGIEAHGKVQFNMWMVAILWIILFCPVYLFRSGAQAWLWLGSANVLAFTALALGRYLLGGS